MYMLSTSKGWQDMLGKRDQTVKLAFITVFQDNNTLAQQQMSGVDDRNKQTDTSCEDDDMQKTAEAQNSGSGCKR